MVEPSRKIWTAAHIRPRIEFREIPLNQWAWKTACVFNRSSLGTECVGYETKASNETRRMAHAPRGCPTRSVPACLWPRDWHADRAVHPRPFVHYRRSRDPSPAPMKTTVPRGNDKRPAETGPFIREVELNRVLPW